MLMLPCVRGGVGARSVPHGELVQRGQHPGPRLLLPHQPAVQHGVQRLRGAAGHDGGRELDDGRGSGGGPPGRGGEWRSSCPT